MRLSAFALFITLGLSTLAAPAYSQAIQAGVDNDLNISFDRAFSNIENPFLSDSIKLNYQITLLEKMTQRQAELTKISEAFKALGIPYNEPAPSYTLCGQLPPNVPCLRHFPNLYPSLVSERRQFYAEMEVERAIETGVINEQVASIDPALAERAKKEREAAAKRAEVARLEREAIERQNRYQWSEVNCVVGKCVGVVTGASGFRASVHVGSRLPDNSIVEAVSRFGIRMVIDGEKIDLRPYPAGSDTAATSTAVLDLSNINIPEDRTVRIVNTAAPMAAAAPTSVAAAGVAMEAPVTPPSHQMTPADMMGSSGGIITPQGASTDTGPGGVTMVEPTLGPSGLF